MPTVSTILPSLVPQHPEQPLQMSDDIILMGEIAYNYLACAANGTPGQWYPDWLGYSPLPEDTYGGLDHLYFASPTTSHSSMYVLTSTCSPKCSNVSSQ